MAKEERAMIRFEQRGQADLTPMGNLPGWFSALLRLRGIETEKEAKGYLASSPDQLHDPLSMPGMAAIVRLIREAIARQDTIMVYGDYDADGVCAAAILAETLREEGAKADIYLPSRHREGYGLNREAVENIARDHQVLITVDCGISNLEEVRLAKERGMTVIVTDHHEPPETLPPADVAMDPLLGGYPYPRLCGAGVALKICQALQGMTGVRKRLDLAALATVADVVPLTGENRAIVREGFRVIERTSRPGLQALLKVSGCTPPLKAEHLAFRLGPRLNAAGRLEDARLGVELLTTRDPQTAQALAVRLDENNRRRQELEHGMTAQATEQLNQRPAWREEHLIVVQGEGWNPGLIGLTAGRLCEKHHLPTIALATREDGMAVGSCRSIPGVNIYRMLTCCAGLLERFGGHEQAAGLTIAADRIDAFRDQLSRIIREECEDSCFEAVKEYDLCVPFSIWNPESIALLDQLEPLGCENPEPLFLAEGAAVQSMRRVGRDFSHLKCSFLDRSGVVINGIAFSQGDVADQGYRQVDLLYRPVLNEFRGRVSVEAQIVAIRKSNT